MNRLSIRIAICALTFLLGIGFALYRGGFYQSADQARPEFQSSLQSVFSDFKLVAESPNDWDIPTHGTEAVPFPLKFEAGHSYILHHAGSLTDTLLYQELITRLRAQGINISEADASSRIRQQHLMFRIAFEDAKYAGYIERPLIEPDPDDDGKDACPLTDYVLVITQAR